MSTHRFQVRGLWCGSSDLGYSRADVAAALDQIQASGINCILPNLKRGDGSICWPSSKFPQLVAPEYRDFDLPAVTLEEARRRGIECHCWMIDFYEGSRGPAFAQHPEWAVRNAKGQPTNSETLRGKPFDAVWMCPAQRPGYTDQWLVPIYQDFAERYDWDALHHDYIRYPGDLAPDQYCYCDDCLKHLPEWAGLLNPSYPGEPFYHELYDRPYLEAHWEPSPRVLPPNWHALDRESQSRFLLEGAFFQAGRHDLDYFFYKFRTHWVTEFARESYAAMKAARPTMRMSAALFKNPIHSGRFIGQDWREFAPYVDTCIPMDYRDHFPGTFDQFLTLLQDAVKSQKDWARDYQRLWIGTAINFLYKEEERLGNQPRSADAGAKLRAVVECIRSTEVEGIVLFCKGHLDEYDLWHEASKAFASDG